MAPLTVFNAKVVYNEYKDEGVPGVDPTIVHEVVEIVFDEKLAGDVI
jgi:hypothetical protein